MPEPRDIENQPLRHGDEVLIRGIVSGQHNEYVAVRPLDERYGRELRPISIEARLCKKVRGGQPPPFNEGPTT